MSHKLMFDKANETYRFGIIFGTGHE